MLTVICTFSQKYKTGLSTSKIMVKSYVGIDVPKKPFISVKKISPMIF